MEWDWGGGNSPPLLHRGPAARALPRRGRGRRSGGIAAGLAQARIVPRARPTVAMGQGDHPQRGLQTLLPACYDPRAAHRPPARGPGTIARGRRADADRRAARAWGALARRPSYG